MLKDKYKDRWFHDALKDCEPNIDIHFGLSYISNILKACKKTDLNKFVDKSYKLVDVFWRNEEVFRDTEITDNHMLESLKEDLFLKARGEIFDILSEFTKGDFELLKEMLYISLWNNKYTPEEFGGPLKDCEIELMISTCDYFMKNLENTANFYKKHSSFLEILKGLPDFLDEIYCEKYELLDDVTSEDIQDVLKCKIDDKSNRNECIEYLRGIFYKKLQYCGDKYTYSQLESRGYIDRGQVQKLLVNGEGSMTKDFIIKICIALNLNVYQTEKALRMIGFTILSENKRDEIIKLGIDNRLEIEAIDYMLVDIYNEPPLINKKSRKAKK